MPGFFTPELKWLTPVPPHLGCLAISLHRHSEAKTIISAFHCFNREVSVTTKTCATLNVFPLQENQLRYCAFKQKQAAQTVVCDATGGLHKVASIRTCAHASQETFPRLSEHIIQQSGCAKRTPSCRGSDFWGATSFNWPCQSA